MQRLMRYREKAVRVGNRTSCGARICLHCERSYRGTSQDSRIGPNGPNDNRARTKQAAARSNKGQGERRASNRCHAGPRRKAGAGNQLRAKGRKSEMSLSAKASGLLSEATILPWASPSESSISKPASAIICAVSAALEPFTFR